MAKVFIYLVNKKGERISFQRIWASEFDNDLISAEQKQVGYVRWIPLDPDLALNKDFQP